MNMNKITIYDFVPQVLTDLYDNSSLCLFMSDEGYFASDNPSSDKWFIGNSESDVIEYLSSLL